jgi:hypothetical protein
MRRVLAILLTAAVAMIAADPPLATPPNASQLAGIYYTGDHLGYNINLELKANGEYSASWHGCLGLYGTAFGNWTLSGTVITLNPINETDMMKGHLRVLNVVKKGDDFAFVPDLKDDFYQKYGVDEHSAFIRQKPSPTAAPEPATPPLPPRERLTTTERKTNKLTKPKFKLDCKLFTYDIHNVLTTCEVDPGTQVFINDQPAELKDGIPQRMVAFEHEPPFIVTIRAIDKNGNKKTQTIKAQIQYQ